MLVTSAKARDSGEKFSAHLYDLSNNKDKLETASTNVLLEYKYVWKKEIIHEIYIISDYLLSV